MKKDPKNEIEMLALINKIQEQLLALDKKMDALISRSLPEVKSSPKPLVNNTQLPVRPNDHHKGRQMYKAICADCKKECSIPFKPNGDRPVYCQDCFSRRKVMNMAGMKIDDKPKEAPPIPTAIEIKRSPAKTKKKPAPAKKPIAKKKSVPKKK